MMGAPPIARREGPGPGRIVVRRSYSTGEDVATWEYAPEVDLDEALRRRELAARSTMSLAQLVELSRRRARSRAAHPRKRGRR